MTLRLTDLARTLGLTLHGEDRDIHGVNTLELAGPNDVSFLANARYERLLTTTRAGAVIISAEHVNKVPCALVSSDPYRDFGRTVALFARPQGCFSGRSDAARVAGDADVADDCVIYPFVFIGSGAVIGAGTVIFPGCYIGEQCRIGKQCVLHPNAVLLAGTILGDRVMVNAGAVLGSEGFGFAPTEKGLMKIPQIGHVEIGDDVEIGANTTIDRAVLNATSIGNGTKIDNLVQVAHNVRIGKHCVLVGQVGIAGSTQLGDGVTLAGQAGIAGHLQIGDGATIGPQSGISKSIPAGAVVGGTPGMDRNTFLRTMTLLPKLPDLARRISALEKELDHLKEQLGGIAG